MVEERLPQEQVPLARTPAPKMKPTQGKKAKEDTAWGLAKPRKTPVTRSVPLGEKRKLRSQGEPDIVSLPESKRARSKSKSPPSREGAKAVVTQAGASEERSIRYPPRGHDQVSTMIIFGRLFETFAYLEGIKCTREVCVQEKVSTPTTINPTTR